jgi:hypothetical protein
MNRLRIVSRLVRNYWTLVLAGETPEAARAARRRWIPFHLNLCPPYNLACYAWMRASTGPALSKSAIVRSLSRWLVRRGYVYGGLRYCSPELRDRFASLIAQDGAAPQPIEPLRTRGFASLGQLLPPQEVARAREFFERERGYNSQVPLQSSGALIPYAQFLAAGGRDRYFSFSPHVSLRCPQIVSLLNMPAVRDIVDRHLGPYATLYSVNTFATAPGQGDHYVMRVHRDYDSFVSLAIFIYWTDVDADNGATVYLPGTHHTSEGPKPEPEYLAGAAGSAYIIEPFALHAGNRRLKSHRLVTWIRYGLTPNLASIQDRWSVESAAVSLS